MDNIPLVQIVDGVQDLFDGLRSIFLCEFTVFTDAIEQFTTRCQLGDDIVFILEGISMTVLCLSNGHVETDPRLEPVDEVDNVRVVQRLQHLQFIVDHLLIPLHILLEDDLDGNFSRAAVGFTDNAICTRAEGPSESVLSSVYDKYADCVIR